MKCYNCGRKGHYVRDIPKVLLPTKILDINVCSHAFVANSLPQWIVDMRATKHIVQDKAGFVEFHRYSVDSRTVVLGNDSEEDVFGVGTYQLRLRGGNKLRHSLCSWGVMFFSFFCFINENRFFFQFSY